MLIQHSKDPLMFRRLVRRFLQNAASLTNLMALIVIELAGAKAAQQKLQVDQAKKNLEMMAAHKSELDSAFERHYSTSVKPICGNYLHEVAFSLESKEFNPSKPPK